MTKKIDPLNQSTDLVFKPHSSLPPFRSLVTGAVLIWLLMAFINGTTIKFYASFLFLFYSWTGMIWISVIMLGAFQTLILVPLRVVNLRLSMNIKELREQIEKTKKNNQLTAVKKAFIQGDFRLLWYLINFMVQSISYLSLGRLFLIDFYSTKLSKSMLYSFAPYPVYPIRSTFFKIPYLTFTDTIDNGMGMVWAIWILALLYKFVASKFLSYVKRKMKSLAKEGEEIKENTAMKFLNYTSNSVILIMIIVWFLIRKFPTNWELKIFTGDVSIPNPTLNTITAIMTFLIILWNSVPKILNKKKLIKKLNYSRAVIRKTQTEMFKQALQNATVLGIGAYSLTRLIPSAFELSIFTLEVISLLSPFTLDKMILNSNINQSKQSNSKQHKTKSDSK